MWPLSCPASPFAVTCTNCPSGPLTQRPWHLLLNGRSLSYSYPDILPRENRGVPSSQEQTTPFLSLKCQATVNHLPILVSWGTGTGQPGVYGRVIWHCRPRPGYSLEVVFTAWNQKNSNCDFIIHLFSIYIDFLLIFSMSLQWRKPSLMDPKVSLALWPVDIIHTSTHRIKLFHIKALSSMTNVFFFFFV